MNEHHLLFAIKGLPRRHHVACEVCHKSFYTTVPITRCVEHRKQEQQNSPERVIAQGEKA